MKNMRNVQQFWKGREARMSGWMQLSGNMRELPEIPRTKLTARSRLVTKIIKSSLSSSSNIVLIIIIVLSKQIYTKAVSLARDLHFVLSIWEINSNSFEVPSFLLDFVNQPFASSKVSGMMQKLLRRHLNFEEAARPELRYARIVAQKQQEA